MQLCLSAWTNDLLLPVQNAGQPYNIKQNAVVFLLVENRNALTRVVCSVGKNTLGMYLGHYLFIFLIYHFWNVEKMQERILAYLAVCIGSYVLSLVLNPLLKKI